MGTSIRPRRDLDATITTPLGPRNTSAGKSLLPEAREGLQECRALRPLEMLTAAVAHNNDKSHFRPTARA
jgi:hypothetical protein